MQREHIHFVTGRLAEHSLRELLAELAPEVGFDYTIDVLNITVAALMTPQWVAKRIKAPPATTRIVLPGYCSGDLAPIQDAAKIPVDLGPKDLRRLPEFFGQTRNEDYGGYEIEILAEINHAPKLSLDEILAEAARLRDAGADLIDVGCIPGDRWSRVGEAVRALRDAGHRVSIDSMDTKEIGLAVEAGAELVLSVNASNRDAAPDWGCQVVAIPDDPKTLEGLDETISQLARAGVPQRIDPILEPIGFGFAESLGRYLNVRRRYPDAEMMMGIGNLTELTEVDSAGVNVLLLGFCAELGIRSVLTTEVINWARSSTRECDVARRLVHYAVQRKTLPKHIDPRLIMLRDADVLPNEPAELDHLAQQIKDHNYRIFNSRDKVHVVSTGLHLSDADPFRLFEKLLAAGVQNVDAAHAFYLGFEMCKAATALALGKQYQQDESLDWGLLTVAEQFHRLCKTARQPDNT